MKKNQKFQFLSWYERPETGVILLKPAGLVLQSEEFGDAEITQFEDLGEY